MVDDHEVNDREKGFNHAFPHDLERDLLSGEESMVKLDVQKFTNLN